MPEGIVVKSTGSWYIVESCNEYFNCKLKGNFKIKGFKYTNPIAVGDRVVFSILKEESIGLIENILPRFNYIIRKATKLSKKSHIIASNLDHAILIVTLALPRTSTGFIDRFTVTAEAYHIPVKIIFNKYDLYNLKQKKELSNLIKIYEQIGYECLITSVKEKYNLDAFKELLQGHTSLVAGHSGVGKSALINAIEPSLNLKTDLLSDFNLKGKHTTTFAQLHKLSFGGYVIDTPGIKEFGLYDFSKEEISQYFPEMRSLMNNCKFNNCSHTSEPGCAIIEAYNNGDMAKSRYNNYVNIFNNPNEYEEDYMR
ncbi:MAG: ribosome small subunit-dependent GTPase A [Bacteroidales bacterium]|nr:ribosome small subunit-dependent GTPase A [Bacteroidales bacterium]